MVNVIVVRIVPEGPVVPTQFTSYLSYTGGLQISAYALSCTSPNQGILIGSASYVAPDPGTPFPTAPIPGPTPDFALKGPNYSQLAGNSIVQQVDLVPEQDIPFVSKKSAYYQFESVATAVIEAPLPPSGETMFENLRLDVQWGSGANARPIPVKAHYFDVPLADFTPDPNDWKSLTPSLYLEIPAPPVTANSVPFTLPSNGTAPSFDLLLDAVKKVLSVDPGTSSTPNLGQLSLEQCRHVAYEIVWSQQKPIPAPPDPIENLYTNPPNDGNLLDGGNPNQNEGDRQQFEANLNSYYSLANATADQLTNYVFALAAAVACEQHSLAATQALLQLPVNPGPLSSAPVSEVEVILTGLGTTAGTSFAVPAPYFYALGATLPPQITALQRYKMAAGITLEHLLSELTSAIDIGTVSDTETFVSAVGMATVNAAQAARRLAALAVPSTSTTALAPLGTLLLPTNGETSSGTNLSFGSTAGIINGNLVTGTGIPANTKVSSFTAISVTLNQVISGDVSVGSLITFTPAFTPELTSLVQAWLAYPPSAPSPAAPSSTTYQPTDEATMFWPVAAKNFPTAFLDLVLSALTQGFITPAPTSTALGQEIISWLTSSARTVPSAAPPATVATLASVTVEQWTRFFQANPAWLPPFTMPGNTAARIAAFVRYVQKFFDVTANRPSSLQLVTNADAPPSSQSLSFPSTTGVVINMSVSGAGIPSGTTVSAVTATSVTLNQAVVSDVPGGTNITFTANYVASASGDGLPLLPAPSRDWIASCLNHYQATPFAFGSGLDLPQLQDAAAQVFPDDATAQAWLVYALQTVDELYRIVNAVGSQTFSPAFAFSVVEGLYARGFTSISDVTALSNTEFQRALTGTVAYNFADELYHTARSITEPPSTTVPGRSGFKPINPDGWLMNCIPPPCRSPLGPIAYLKEILSISEASTCQNPLAAASTGRSTLADVIAQRRGSLGSLAASGANLETFLPVIDLVNECLEYMAASSSPTHGTVYDTSEDAVAGYRLCRDENLSDAEASCHKASILLSALPEYSTPASPVLANSSVEPLAYDYLRSDFSSCSLPYSQALDVNRTYLRHLGTCRYEVMRTFRKCITEFVLDPSKEPAGFQSHLWRYPVRIDLAIEYLGMTPEEYVQLFQGAITDSCGPVHPRPRVLASSALSVWQLFGFASDQDGNSSWVQTAIRLPEFLDRTCLTYCHFLELWKSGFIKFGNGADRTNGSFPDCEPCCLDKLWLHFSDGQTSESDALYQLAVFIRLWRKLQDLCGAAYSFNQLRDICEVFQLFKGTAVNPDFVRQLAAFQILRDQFSLKLADTTDRQAAGATGADRTQLLALWVGPAARKWPWATGYLIERVAHYARHRHRCEPRSPEFLKLLASNLDPLSRLSGFDPALSSDTWHCLPTHTLRFAEVLAKIYASNWTIGEILYLFTMDPHLDGDDPFPLQEENEALDLPFAFPNEEDKYSLWQLRRKLLEVHVPGEEVSQWTWKRVESCLRNEFGYTAGDLLSLAEHFFPSDLGSSGVPIGLGKSQYSTNLTLQDTVPAMWNNLPEGPFEYDASAQLLWMRLPLSDRAVFEQLMHVRALNAREQQAVQDLYYQPRKTLAAFAFLFADFAEAERYLIEGQHESERWAYFQRQFALAHTRCRVLADHLAEHVASETGKEQADGKQVASLLLRNLVADENKAQTDWEEDSGQAPVVTWTPPSNGGAYAALLGLIGTGVLIEFTSDGTTPIWRTISGALCGFGPERNHRNDPVPTVLPAMDLALPPDQMRFVTVRNGLATRDVDGVWLGGAQGFQTKWTGALLIEHEGAYEFFAGAPTPPGERPDLERAEHCQWRIILQQGQKTWVLLQHHWHGEHFPPSSSLRLKRGVYELLVDFIQLAPNFSDESGSHPHHTGFQIKYAGRDTHDKLIEIPHSHLFLRQKDEPLGAGITQLSNAASDFLNQRYTSSLRDIRRTYQRAFKALLFVQRFGLSAKPASGGQSELGYMLAEKQNFAGLSYYRTASEFTKHTADFDFNFLPITDNYYEPSSDPRAHPSAKRIQAMFDWWERIFDYDRVRREVRRVCERHLWLLFEEAQERQPAHPAYLLRHLCADSRDWQLESHYYQDQHSPTYTLTSADLADDRWVVRAWRVDQWIRSLLHSFRPKDVTKALPTLWASQDPASVVEGQTETGDGNLLAFLCDGSFDNGEPHRYEMVKRLNDGLRDRGRQALISYLSRMNRVALPWAPAQFVKNARDLSDILLLDVQAGICETATRIDEAISAVQSFVRRARLGLEPNWVVTRDFALLWDQQFATFHTWEVCKRRKLYKENTVEWAERQKAQRVESFRLLESELRKSSLSVAVPGGLEWWPDQSSLVDRGFELLEKHELAEVTALSPSREGLDLLATPERNAQPSWLTAVTSTTPRTVRTESSTVAMPSMAGKPQIPLWMETAIRLGKRFWRIAAAGVPSMSSEFIPYSRQQTGKCCAECECIHPVLADEYYFWLVEGDTFTPPAQDSQIGSSVGDPKDYQHGYQNDFYDVSQQQSTFWEDSTQLPQLLTWNPNPVVRLAWCRIHHGEFQQPRQSVFGVRVQSIADADFTFEGRTADSLTFSVTNAVTESPALLYLDPSSPGFRYDLATDSAVVLPLVSTPPVSETTYPGSLPAYPYFIYYSPGESSVPLSLFTPALTIASALRAHCRFETALKWYRLVYDPLQQDCAWLRCSQTFQLPPGTENVPSSTHNPPTNVDQPPGSDNNPIHVHVRRTDLVIAEGEESQLNACCDSTAVSDAVVRNRAILFNYLDTLLEFGRALMRGNSPEALEQARLVFDVADRVLGKQPRSVQLPEPISPQTVATFVPYFAPLSPRLLDLYTEVHDRLSLVHGCLDAYRIHEGGLRRDMRYFGDNLFRAGRHTALEVCPNEAEWCRLHSPYRFLFLIQKAQEYAAKLRELSGTLLSAFEKGDAEYLASLRTRYEREVATLGLSSRKDQWRDADWQIEALQKTKAMSQANLSYYNQLIQGDLINGEIAYRDLTVASTVLRGVSNGVEAVGQGADIVPNTFYGVAGFGGTPLFYQQLPIGQPLGSIFAAGARILNSLADAGNSTAGLELTEAGWQRRSDEWTHQAQVLAIEIQQIERQILGAQRRRDQALQELNSQNRQIEQSTEVENFLRDKFTGPGLYLWLQKETATLYGRMYDLAIYAARQAEQAFNFERGYKTERFIPNCSWNSLKEGLTAGERLDVALSQMEKEYLDKNLREFELTKHFSLRVHFPMEYLRLRTTGSCEIELPEWMFDLDYPGMFMRRIKNVTVTIPCVTGPYTGVHCRLTLLSSMTRIDSRVIPPPQQCCSKHQWSDEYNACPHDPRILRHYAAREAIATSSGRDDSGMFELNFRDDRYLPFEYLGAVSRWRIEMPAANNYFDMDSLSDLILHLNYTAREGGDVLRHAANRTAQKYLPGDGWSFFEIRHDFPDAWQLFRTQSDGKKRKQLTLPMSRHMFPYVPSHKELWIDKVALLFGAPDEPGDNREHMEQCACSETKRRDSYEITVRGFPEQEDREEDETKTTVTCLMSPEWPGLYHGLCDTQVGPLTAKDHRSELGFKFPDDVVEVSCAYLVCRYTNRDPISLSGRRRD